jgi:uncharacterized spore protein YtfJ
MEMRFEEMLHEITDFIKSEIKTETVIGQQFKLGEFSCVPVIKVGMGFGSGGGEGEDGKKAHGQGMGAGAGMGIEPIGFLVTKGENITFLASGRTKGLAAAFEQVPGLIEKYFETKRTAEMEPA